MERLALDRFASPWLRNQHLARYRWASGFAKDRRVLDAACGTGYGSRLMAGAGALRVTSIDVSPQAALAARRSGDLRFLNFVRADATRLPLPDGAVDLYACFETIEHVEDDEALLLEARRVLAPEGRLLCSTPNRDLLSPGLTIEDRPANPYHLREYAIAEFRALLARFFPRVELFGQTWFSKRHVALLARAGERSSLLAVRLHQLRNLSGLPWENERRHEPAPLEGPPRDGAPEVVIGVCGA
jgi:ubiquinone/menaquinone biosynthesis C-methylase UbiE